MSPFFSIITPCCDVEPYVRECFDSVLNQPFADWEIIVGVETSADRTEAIVREYAAKDARVRMFTGPRSGGCSATRNRGVNTALGEYVIFLDGDDTIAEGSLQRLHDKIAARPGADLYPCAIRVNDEIMHEERPLRDNYPPDFADELTGPEATRMVYTRQRDPCPMLQMTVFRRRYLIENGLECGVGLRREDSEFSPRALYLAKRVAPLHEPFYNYRIRSNSIMTSANNPDYFLKDYARILKSLYAFHAKVSRERGFDRRISPLWAAQWLTWPYFFWFSPRAIRTLTKQRRHETLAAVFENGFGDFDALTNVSTIPRKVAALFLKLFVRHPSMGWLADMFFIYAYYPLTNLRDTLLRR